MNRSIVYCTWWWHLDYILPKSVMLCICLSYYLSMYLPVYLSIYLSLYLYTYTYLYIYIYTWSGLFATNTTSTASPKLVYAGTASLPVTVSEAVVPILIVGTTSTPMPDVTVTISLVMLVCISVLKVIIVVALMRSIFTCSVVPLRTAFLVSRAASHPGFGVKNLVAFWWNLQCMVEYRM